MYSRLASRLAWLVFALAVALVTSAFSLAVVNTAQSADLRDFGLAYALIALTYGFLGAVIVARHPSNRVGWLFCVIGLPSGVSCLADQYGRLALVTRPGSLPGGSWATWVGAWAWLLTPLTFSFLLLVFPDGHLPSPRWRPVLWLSAAVLVVFATLGMLTPRSVLAAAFPEGLVTPLPGDNPLAGETSAGSWFAGGRACWRSGSAASCSRSPACSLASAAPAASSASS
jgi:hypothetical protein